jgi:uncharacterized protein (TIGR02118 family)
MVVISVMYPATPGSRFDLGYYTGVHLPLVRRLLDPMGLKSLTYWQPDAPSPYQLIAELRFAGRESMMAALQAHGAETQADIPNFTDAAPVIIMGEERAG